MELRRKHTLHSGLNFFNCIIDDSVKADINTVTLCIFLCNGVRTNVEANDDSVRCVCEHNVALGNSTYAAVDNFNANFVVGELFKRLTNSFNRTLNVCLDDDRKFLDLARSG